MKTNSIRRKDVLDYIRSINDQECWTCDTCKHYCQTMICGECHSGSRFVFAWRVYAEERRSEIEQYIEKRKFSLEAR